MRGMRFGVNDILFVLATFLSVWFALTGFIWAYGAALYFAYPAGIVSFLLWLFTRSDKRKRNMVIGYILAAGLVVSLVALLITQ